MAELTRGGRNSVNASVSLTRLGWQFLFIGSFAMIGGVIRAYNLPLALAGLIVATLLVHWRWSRHTVRSLVLRRQLPEEAYANQPFVVRVRVGNRSRWLPSWLVRVDDDVLGVDQDRERLVVRLLRFFRGKKTRPRAACGLGAIPPGRTLTAEYRCRIGRRGKYKFGPICVSTGSPFGMLIYRRRIESVDRLWVYPEPLGLLPGWRNRLIARSSGESMSARRRGGLEGEFFGIRGWRAGDSRRWIHWRTTARIGEPAVRQFEQDRRLQVCLILDAYLPAGTRGGEDRDDDDARVSVRGGDSPEADLEQVIRFVATMVTGLNASSGDRIGLVLAGERITPMVSLGGREQTVGILRALAELAGHPTPNLAEAVRQAYQHLGKPRVWLVVSPRRQEDLGEEPILEQAGGIVCSWLSTVDGSLEQLIDASRVTGWASTGRADADGSRQAGSKADPLTAVAREVGS